MPSAVTGQNGADFVEEAQLGAKCYASAGGFDLHFLFGFALWCPRWGLVNLGALGSFYAVLYASCCEAVC